jgi:hypothetical protein
MGSLVLTFLLHEEKDGIVPKCERIRRVAEDEQTAAETRGLDAHAAALLALRGKIKHEFGCQ